MPNLLRLLIWYALAIVWAHGAMAQICSPVPVTLTAGTPARASDVMSNFDSTTNCVNANAAKNGANSDITSLTGLTTPLSPAQGGTSLYTSAVSSTVANTFTGNSTTPSDYSLTTSKLLWFVAPATTTGASTMNAISLGAKSIKRSSTGGKINTAAGSITSGQVYGLTYDGTDYVMVNPTPRPPEVTYVSVATPLGTYTTPAGALWLKATFVGGGGGGSGGPGGAGTNGNLGGNSAFGGSAVALGGAGGVNTGGVPAASGVSGLATVALTGGTGRQGAPSSAGVVAGVGGAGGDSCLGSGGAGIYNGAGQAGNGPGGGGGGGAPDGTVSNIGGSGGSAGGCAIVYISGPLSATYSYTVGNGGAGGPGGAGGFAGGNGAPGALIIEAYFQ